MVYKDLILTGKFLIKESYNGILFSSQDPILYKPFVIQFTVLSRAFFSEKSKKLNDYIC